MHVETTERTERFSKNLVSQLFPTVSHITYITHHPYLTVRGGRSIWWCWNVTFRSRRNIWPCLSVTFRAGAAFGSRNANCCSFPYRICEAEGGTVSSTNGRVQSCNVMVGYMVGSNRPPLHKWCFMWFLLQIVVWLFVAGPIFDVGVLLFAAGATFGDVGASLFLAGATFVGVSIFVAGATFGDVGKSLFEAGVTFRDVWGSLFVAGAAFGEILVDSRNAKCCIFSIQNAMPREEK